MIANNRGNNRGQREINSNIRNNCSLTRFIPDPNIFKARRTILLMCLPLGNEVRQLGRYHQEDGAT
jgi:hypothetical protein